MSNLAVRADTRIARPLKVLVPLIQSELKQGYTAGLEHFRRAGEMLIEAKDQVPYGQWARWLTKNFELSRSTAYIYMNLAKAHLSRPSGQLPYASMNEMRGGTERRRERRQAEQPFFHKLQEVGRERDEYAQERQRVVDEIALHRQLAEELIDLGYRALAIKLHPDRGGSPEAMMRLNRVRDELMEVAQTRRFK